MIFTYNSVFVKFKYFVIVRFILLFIFFATINVDVVAESLSFQPVDNHKNSQWYVDETGRYFLVDSLNRKISEHSYDFGDYIVDTVAVSVRNNGLWGAISLSGKEIIPCVYESVDCCTYVPYDWEFWHVLGENSYIIFCQKKGQYYVYDKDGNLLIDNCFFAVNLMHGNILFVQRKRGRLKLYSLRDRNINTVEDKRLKFGSFSYFDENGISVVVLKFNVNSINESYLFGAVDASGKYVVPCIYKKEEEVMAKIGRTERSFKYLNNK